MIEVKNVHKHFNGFHALKGISLSVKENEIYGFIGHNGAGKSTTMNIITGLSSFSEGQCFVNGKDVKTIDQPGELKVGFLPENPQFYPWMTAHEYLMYCSKTKDVQNVDKLLEWSGLKAHAKRKIKGYSRGMKQRLGMAVALVHDPELLILDEPSSALDPEGRSEILNMMIELKKMGKTIIFSSHILSDIERICDRVGMIAEGEMVFEKTLKQLLFENIQPIYEITVEHEDVQQLALACKDIQDAKEVNVESKTIIIRLKHNTSSINPIITMMIDKETTILEFARKKNDLESLFIREGKEND